MIALIWTLIGGVRGLFTAAATAAAVWVAMTAYDRLVDDPAVAAAARRDFVARAELDAERARADELQRQVHAGQIVIDAYTEVAKNARAAEEETQAKMELAISTYETRLKEAGRSCKINGDDLEFLTK